MSMAYMSVTSCHQVGSVHVSQALVISNMSYLLYSQFATPTQIDYVVRFCISSNDI